MANKLFSQERRTKIMTILKTRGRVSVTDLSEEFDLSAVTIRNDLEVLAAEGLLLRTHGGALPIVQTELELSFNVRLQINSAQKRCIGRVAAGMVQDGDAIALDASTTALALAKELKGFRELTVVTNSIYIALELLNMSGITILMPGGFVRRDSVSLVGPEGYGFIEKFNFQKGFFGAKGLTLEEGLTDVNNSEVAVKKGLLGQTKQVVGIVDSSKWGQVSFASFASLDQIDRLITDQNAPPDMLAALRERGIEVIIA